MLFTRDKKFYSRLIFLAIPMLLQNLLSASLNFIDTFMIGSLGEVSSASVGAANQFVFVFIMLIFGLASGAAMFTAQYWGKKDLKSIRSVMGISITLTLCISTVATLIALIAPGMIMRIYSSDPAVIENGASYLVLIALSFILMSLTVSYSVVLRSTENVIYPMIASIVGVILNTILNYLLIFGSFGFPELGIRGAAIATVIARSVEMLIILFITYFKKLPAASGFKDMFGFTKEMILHYLKRAIPVIVQSVGWSAGFSLYSAVYGRLDTGFLAAFNIAGSIERISVIFLTGLGSACAIMVGNRIGAGEEDKARTYAKTFLSLGVCLSFVLTAAHFVLSGPVSSIYSGFSEDNQRNIAMILIIFGLIMWAKASNIIFHMGIFRAGGDTLFSMIVDLGGVWLIGLPIAAIAGFVFGAPPLMIVALVSADEIIKMIVGYIRFGSGKWLNNLTVSQKKNNAA